MLHRSQKLLYLCLFFIAGIFCASVFGLETMHASSLQKHYLLYLISFVFTIIIIGILKNFRFIFIIICGLVFYFGIYHYQQSFEKEYNYFNKQITFQGIIIKEPDVREAYTQLTLTAKKFQGRVLVKTNVYPSYAYGDLLEVKCKIQKPEPVEGFSYDKYLARYGIYATCTQPRITLIKSGQGNLLLNTIFIFKNKCKKVIEVVWTLPVSAFMSGILLGLKRGLPQEVADYFKRTGTIHILVISGLHVLIISSLINQSLKHFYIPRPKKIYAMAIILSSFVIFTGAAPSVTRAVLMALTVLLAEKFGRPKTTLNVLVFAATLMLLHNPKILVFDMGFQLSFLATVGLVYLSDKVEKILIFIPKLLGMRSLLAASMSAILLTNPLILYQFQKFSVIAPLANIIIVPFIPVIMSAGLFILGVGLIWTQAAQILGWGLMLVVTFVIETAKYLSGFEWASIEVEKFHWIWLVLVYGIIFLVIRRINNRDC